MLLLAALLAACPAAAPFAGFEHPSPVAAARARRDNPLPLVRLNQPARVALAPTRAILLETPSEHAAAPASHGGLLELRVPLSGTYRFALDGHAWLDLSRGGKLVAPAAHGHGPACGPVRKIVDFALPAGTYTVQLSDAASAAITLMVAPAR